jgi:hypothetical protein
MTIETPECRGVATINRGAWRCCRDLNCDLPLNAVGLQFNSAARQRSMPDLKEKIVGTCQVLEAR